MWPDGVIGPYFFEDHAYCQSKNIDLLWDQMKNMEIEDFHKINMEIEDFHIWFQ